MIATVIRTTTSATIRIRFVRSQRSLDLRLSRREALKGVLASLAVMAVGNGLSDYLSPRSAAAASGPSTLTFEEVLHGVGPDHQVASGYTAQVLIRWGDPLAADVPKFDAMNLTPAVQERQFGYNCDYVAFMPLPLGSTNAEHGLLCVNHEYTSTDLMFPGLTAVQSFPPTIRPSLLPSNIRQPTASRIQRSTLLPPDGQTSAMAYHHVPPSWPSPRTTVGALAPEGLTGCKMRS